MGEVVSVDKLTSRHEPEPTTLIYLRMGLSFKLDREIGIIDFGVMLNHGKQDSVSLQSDHFGNDFHEALVSHYSELNGYFTKRTSCAAEAEDLTQETFRRTIKCLMESQFRQPKHLLYRIAKNLLIDEVRKKQFRKTECLGDELIAFESKTEVTPLRRLEANERLEKVREHLDTLPERCREVCILHRFGGLTYKQISEKLEISESTVEKHMIKAIASCRRVLQDQ